MDVDIAIVYRTDCATHAMHIERDMYKRVKQPFDLLSDGACRLAATSKMILLCSAMRLALTSESSVCCRASPSKSTKGMSSVAILLFDAATQHVSELPADLVCQYDVLFHLHTGS